MSGDSPKLSYAELEVLGPGVELRLLDLLRQGTPIAPFKASRFTVEPGCQSGVDQHAVRECWIITSGCGQVLYDGRRFAVQRDDVLFFDSHRSHQVINDGHETMIIYSVWWSQ